MKSVVYVLEGRVWVSLEAYQSNMATASPGIGYITSFVALFVVIIYKPQMTSYCLLGETEEG